MKITDIFETFIQPQADLLGEYDCREDCVLRLYGGMTTEGFEEYTAVLRDAGFALLQSGETDGNLFALLRSTVTVTALYTPCDGCLRLTAAQNAPLPLLSGDNRVGTGQTVFFAFENDHTVIDCGMCLLVQCADGSFFIVDSGHYFQFNDNDRIYKFMRERTPEGNKVVVNGWLITHGHTDHISKLIDFLKYNTDDVIIEGFYQNLPNCDFVADDEESHEEKEMAQKLFRILEQYPAPVYKLHTGMRFFVRELCFNVLYTHEDTFPARVTDYNDSSCVVMLEARGTRIFIPGDAALKADEVLTARYAAALKCDIVQIAHHGHTGLSPRFYELAAADAAVFPVTRIMFEDELPRKQANRRAVELAKEYFITSDGTAVFPLPYKPGTAYALPDETFEDFQKIRRVWRYVYPKERMDRLYELFIKNGGDPEKLLLPTSRYGWIEPKPPIGDENG